MPPTEIVENTLILIGVFAFALSGALLAVREKFDIVGMAVLATATAVGGGVNRGVLMGDVPPAALTDPWSLLLPLGAAVLTFSFTLGWPGWDAPCNSSTRSGSVSSVPCDHQGGHRRHPAHGGGLLGTITGVGGQHPARCPGRADPIRAQHGLVAVRHPSRRRFPSWSPWPTHSVTAIPRSRLLRPSAFVDSDSSR